MKTKETILKTIMLPAIAFLFLIYPAVECMADLKSDSYKILASHITRYNGEMVSSLSDPEAYKGEEGVLCIKPDTAQKLGLRVYIDQDYRDSVKLNKEAEDALSSAVKALSYRGKKESEHAIQKKMLLNILIYREKSQLAKEKLSQYRKNVKKEIDERFNSDVCNKTIVTLLEEGLKNTNNNLRDSLGFFYNKCRGNDQSRDHITRENVLFVNHVFNGFITDASAPQINLFSLDSNSRNGKNSDSGDWKSVVREDLPELLPFLESAVIKSGESTYLTDPLLFLALMKRESAFDPKAVSSVGAAGLTQIMPHTAQDLGLGNIYIPKYFYSAADYLKKEGNLKAEANKALRSITNKEDLQLAKKARELMLKSIAAGKKRVALYEKYKKELVNSKKDDRLDPALAIASGYKYFSRLMKSHKGDISLALAAYNAGSRRVRQYKGIPPFDETVVFRNRVLQYYYEYLGRISN